MAVGYCSPSDVRLLTGVSESIISDEEIESLITLGDQQINDDIGVFVGEVPHRIRLLSALLASIKLFSRPDMRFRIGVSGISEHHIDESINMWVSEVKRIYAYYGRALREEPSKLLRC